MSVDFPSSKSSKAFVPAQACPAVWSDRLRSPHLKRVGLSKGFDWRPSSCLENISVFIIQWGFKHPHTSRLPRVLLSQLEQLFERSGRCLPSSRRQGQDLPLRQMVRDQLCCCYGNEWYGEIFCVKTASFIIWRLFESACMRETG